MAGTTPKIYGPDKVLRETFNFTTTLARRFFTGTLDPDTISVNVGIRGAALSSDPDLVYFEGTSFIVPNPAAYPEGLLLLQGENLVEVQSVLSSGSLTGKGQIKALLSQDQDIQGVPLPPSGIYIERLDGTVKVTIDGLSDTNVVGYNFYASTAPGGGNIGYSRINPDLIITGTTIESFSGIATLQIDTNIAKNPDGSPVADPLVFAVRGTQQDKTGTIIETDFDESLDISETVSQIRTNVIVRSVRPVQQFSFTHDRQANLDSTSNPTLPNANFNTVQREDPLYYVVSAVYLFSNVEMESEFSPEVAGTPLTVTPNVGAFPAVSKQQLVRDTALAIYRSHPELDIKPGSVLRDTFIDPFTTEAERIRFIVDFLHNAQSFSTLLAIDDPGFTGTSINVDLSPYKIALRTAFFLQDNASTQALIDNAFDKLASQYGVVRRAGQRSRGEVTFYVRVRPATSVIIPIGTQVSGGGQTFRTTSATQIAPQGAGTFFDPATGRFAARAFIQANTPGEASNVAPNQINAVLNFQGVFVTNESRTFGGQPQEANRALAIRAQGALASVDSGTYQGYLRRALDVPGVQQVNVVDAGHPLMLRDVDPTTGLHRGGKVDIWTRGDSLATVTDAFAFSFEMAKNMHFTVVGDPQDLVFRAVDTRLSSDSPIIEMLDYATYGYKFTNQLGLEFDLTNVIILTPDKIQLDSSLNDPSLIALTDVFFGSYRYRTGNKYVFTRQPVRSIRSLAGDPSRSGTISPSIYALYRVNSPLLFGRSTEAGDYLKITQPLTDTTIPSGEPIPVTNEQHVILSGIEYLFNLGINPLSVVVKNADATITYISPYDPSGTPDYTFVSESGSSPLAIKTTDTSTITDGQVLLVDYSYDENFVVTYTTNALVQVVQETIEPHRHITADVLVKDAVQVPVDLVSTIVLRKGAPVVSADSAVRTALTRVFASLHLGEPLRQSDIIEVIDAVPQVSYVVVPLTKMCKADNVNVTNESVFTDVESDSFQIPDWSTPLVNVWLLKDPLVSSTTSGGGPENEYHGVFMDDVTMVGFSTPPNNNGTPLKNSAGNAFIIGNGGLSIPAYSDLTTLAQKYPLASTTDLLDKQKEITANRVLVSLVKDTTPMSHSFTVSYVVSGDTGVHNIEPGPIEYLTPGVFSFTYDEDVDYSAKVLGKSR